MTISDLDCVILCGGRASRLRSALNGKPKVLAPIDGRPYLDWLVGSLASYGVGRVVLCGGHLSDVLKDWVRERVSDGIRLTLFNELDPHGTGSAMRFLRPFLRSDPVLVINGDTLITADLEAFLREYDRLQLLAGTLIGQIWGTKQYEYAGHYLLSQRALDLLMESPHTMLNEFVEELQTLGSAMHYEEGFYLDIGTPEDLAKAPAFIRENAL